MLKTIDKYIIKKILKTFFFSIIAALAIIVVFDISEKIDIFIKADLSLWQIIIQYYLGFLVHIGNMFFPLFVLITIMLVTLKLNQRSEITAILSTGISFKNKALSIGFKSLPIPKKAPEFSTFRKVK